ncbi:MAG: nuclear transport factor 2 family protein [Alphaproteobacteria bacterium]
MTGGTMKVLVGAAFAAALSMSAAPALAGPLEEANAALDGWAIDYSTGDADTLTRSYWPDATVFGVRKADRADGSEAIRRYYAAAKRPGEQARIGRRASVVLGPDAVVVHGYYELTRLVDGKPVSSFARFTMLFARRGAEWRIAHEHSSEHAEARQ